MKSKKPMKTKLFFIFLFSFCFFYLRSEICHLKSVFAQSFSSSSYKIQWGNFNTGSGKQTSTSYQLTETTGQNAPGKFTNTGYIVKSGFQYIYDILYQFSFQIDNLSMNLGTLVPGVGSTTTNTITISSPAGHGYEILTRENHPLQILNVGTTIIDTKCDSGTCSESISGVWTNNNTYGFGFNATGLNPTGVGTSNYFTDSTYFRQFANFNALEQNQIFMSENSAVKNRSARITYKANISAFQGAGDYENSITFIAIPKY